MSNRQRMIRKIESEAQSHPDGCDCKTCRAAAGDGKARRELLKELL